MSWPTIDLLRPWVLVLIPVALVLVVGSALLMGRGWRDRAAWLRGGVLILLVIALAGPMLGLAAKGSTTIFVVDQSASVQTASRDAADRWVKDTLAQSGIDDSAAVITFGADATLAAPPGGASSVGASWQPAEVTGAEGNATNMESALALANALPVGEQRSIVLMTDGAQTAGDALTQVDQAAASGVPISVVPLAGIGNDLYVASLSGPHTLWQGQDLDVQATIGSDAGGTASVELLVDGTTVATTNAALHPGSTVVPLTATGLTPGFHAVEVRVAGGADIDAIAQNNSAPLGVVVRDKPKVLLVAPEGADTSRLQQALATEGADVSVSLPADVPVRLSELSVYDAIVLNNVPAWTLNEDQQGAIVAHTREGRGLIVVGGSAAYGPGSYAGTTLEDALPVTVKVTDGRQRPRVALMIVMDKSGSMSYNPAEGGGSKIDLAKEGVMSAARALAPGDQLGVLAFNDEPTWAVPMAPIGSTDDLARIQDAIAPLSPDGGTEIYPALQVAYDSMRNVDADVRHIILLSDGKSRSGSNESYLRLVEDIGKDNITLSTVALGSDADVSLLQTLAQSGHGRYHFAEKPDDIPVITFQEARSAGSQSVLRGSFALLPQAASPLLNHLDTSALPPVDAYDFAAARTGAQVDLTSDRRDPLLVKWQMGLGRVVSWLGDDGSDFASQWATWPEYDAFWGNTLRWSLPDPEHTSVTASLTSDGRDAVVTLDALTADGEEIDLTGGRASLTGPEGTAVTLPLVPAGSGIWQVRLTEPLAGAWKLTLEDAGPAAGTEMAITIPPSREFYPDPAASGLVREIADRTGGAMLSLDAPAPGSLFDMATQGNASRPVAGRQVWAWPVIAALVLFLVDIALRLGFFSDVRRRVF
ncbi:MAG TPA: VWA domain-containing protein [Thermomicrobiales bacterium]|nr:VWA domain-containing protein [Thermomicrobiales bacterium]